MDILTDILNTLRLSSSLYFRTELTAPWGIGVPQKSTVARFHIVTHGQCFLRVDGLQDGMFLSSGDLVVIPHGAEHILADSSSTAIRPLAEVLDSVAYAGEDTLVYGGGGAGCCLVCGEFTFDTLGPHPLLENLPAILSISGEQSHNRYWLDSIVGFIGREAANEEPGALAIVDRLSEIILIQVIRATLQAAQKPVPFLSAFLDKRINRVLSAIHANPGNDWSVERLGALVNMSRTVFSNRFSELVRMSPLQYVIFIRLQKASRLLVETDQQLGIIAESIGHQSEAAFSDAFKKHYGKRPGEFRRKYTRSAA